MVFLLWVAAELILYRRYLASAVANPG